MAIILTYYVFFGVLITTFLVSDALQYSSAMGAIKDPKIKRETVSEMINRKKIVGKLPVLKPIVLPPPKPLKNLSKFQIKSRMANINSHDRLKTLETRINEFKARMGVKPQLHARAAFEKHLLADKLKHFQEDLRRKTPLQHRLGTERVGSSLVMQSRFGSDESNKQKTNGNRKEGDEQVIKTAERKKKQRAMPSSTSEIPVIILGPSTPFSARISEKSDNVESDGVQVDTRSAVLERMKDRQKDAMDKIRTKLSTNHIEE